MASGFNSGRTLGTVLMITGAALAIVAVAWLGVNAASGDLEPGGFVLGLFFLMLFILPLLLVGYYIRQRGAAEAVQESTFEDRCRLFERDRITRQTLRREATRAATVVGARLGQLEGESADLLRQTQQTLDGLAEGMAQPVAEADWLHAASLSAQDVRDKERYDDLLLAGLRRIQETAGGSGPMEPATAKALLELARSADRQFALRQDLLLRGRRLPSVSPIHLLRATIPERGQVDPESLRPGGAVSLDTADYLVTAHLTYFVEGRSWHGLVLRGEEGERRLQLQPGADRALFMEAAALASLPDTVEESGSASVSVDSLSGRAEGVVVDYRFNVGGADRVGWWERWPEGEKGFAGQWILMSDLQFWPAAVGSE